MAAPRRDIPPLRTWPALAALAIGWLGPGADAEAQRRPRPLRDQDRRKPVESGSMVTINYGDSVKLAAFVDFVSQATGTTIIYSDELKGQTVMLRPAEVHVPKAQLLELLRGMLRMHELALVNADIEGWLRIVPTDDMQRHVSDIRSEPGADPAAASQGVVTQVLQLETDELPLVVKHLRSFLSSPKASVIEVPEKRILIITDYESSIARALGIVKQLAATPPQAELVTIPVQHADAQAIAERVLQILQDKARLEERKEVRVTLQDAPNAGGVLALGMERDLAQVRELIERFDVPADQRSTVPYAPLHISADRLRKLIESVVATDGPAGADRKYFLDEDANRLYVTAGAATHRRIAELLEREDVLQQEASRPLRLYKPKHRRARDLIATLSEVLPNISTTVVAEDLPAVSSEPTRLPPPGPNRPPAEPGPGVAPPEPPAEGTADAARAIHPARVKRIQGQDFTLSYDDHTNAIIAVGPREFHAKLVTMLEELDRRQPQVLIEMTLVAITFNDSLSLAMELANEERLGDYQSLLFSSFGLSNIAIPSGVRTFHPGGGFNGVILGPNETPILMRAIAAHGNSRIITTPKVVVADNSSATVSSVEEAPFTSINASDTVATTSFAGFESAGTTLTVTPHEAQGDFIALDYSFNFSNFTGSGSVGVPPPRTTNSFSGTIEVPDGHTVIVGGLVTENESDSVTELPLLGRIPLFGALFQSSDRARTKSRVFAFIRPTILRDDVFADLKLISGRELELAELTSNDYPGSVYLWMR